MSTFAPLDYDMEERGGGALPASKILSIPIPSSAPIVPPSSPATASYTYPIKGIGFLAQNPSLWGAVLLPIVASIGIGMVVFILLMGAGLYPQALLFLSHTSLPPWASWLLSVVLVFAETALFSFLLAQIFLDHARSRLYAKVFELNGLQFGGLDRVIYGTGSAYLQWVSQRVIFLFLLCQMLVTLPINALPVIGSICYAGMNGLSLAWALHGVYFEKKGLSFLQQWDYVKAHLHDYFSFGAVAVLLDSIPVFNIVFFYTNIIGSALWAIDMEKGQELENSVPANALIDDVGIIDTDELH